MDTLEHIIWTMEDARSRTLKLVTTMSQDVLRWRPCDTCNSIGATAIHIGRVEDALSVGSLGLSAQIFQEQGWHQKLGLADDDWGWGFDGLSEASQPSADLLGGYLNAVRERTAPFIQGLKPARLAEEVPGRRVRTVAQSLSFIVNEELQHLGQMDYIRGMKEAMGA